MSCDQFASVNYRLRSLHLDMSGMKRGTTSIKVFLFGRFTQRDGNAKGEKGPQRLANGLNEDRSSHQREHDGMIALGEIGQRRLANGLNEDRSSLQREHDGMIALESVSNEEEDGATAEFAERKAQRKRRIAEGWKLSHRAKRSATEQRKSNEPSAAEPRPNTSLDSEQRTSKEVKSCFTREHEFQEPLATERAFHELEASLATVQRTFDELEVSLETERRRCNELQEALEEQQENIRRIRVELSSEQENRQQMERRFAIEEQARQEIERRLATEQQNRQTAENMLHEAEQRAIELQENSQQMERRYALEVQERQERLATEQQNRQRTEDMRQVAEQRANELQTRCDELLLQQSRDWILAREEITLSDRSIGRGAWGEVLEGTFRECTVAVKRIHQLILSDVNRRLFEREMNMASRCRHPCLLQFIGATADDAASPLFVTELLETSLRAVLRERVLEPVEILTIALDVARGLNYLHLNRPDPIIHRDISSGNVLLCRQNNSWRAKISDYGTANFTWRCTTRNPGTPIYSAPEADSVAQQTTKIDVYSFGVLLCEMSIREEPDPLERDLQVSRVSNQWHRELMQRCLLPNPNDRPSMGEVIDILERSRDHPLSIEENL